MTNLLMFWAEMFAVHNASSTAAKPICLMKFSSLLGLSLYPDEADYQSTAG
jgi:hypothetical protein